MSAVRPKLKLTRSLPWGMSHPMGTAQHVVSLLLGFLLSVIAPHPAAGASVLPDPAAPPNCTAPGCQGHLIKSVVWNSLDHYWMTFWSFDCVDYDRECDATCVCKKVVLQGGVLWDTCACSCGGAAPNLPLCYSVFEVHQGGLVDSYFVECRAPTGCGLVLDCRIVVPYQYRCACQ